MRARLLVSVWLFLSLFVLRGLAQDQLQSRVLRASLIEGDVTYLRSDLDQWIDLNVNTPLLEGDKVWVGRDGRAEIEFEDGSRVRLAQNTIIEFTHLGLYDGDSRQAEIQFSGGLATFDVVSESGTLNIATPLFLLQVAKPAQFRVEVESDGSSHVVTFEGRVQIESQQGNLFLDKGEDVRFLSDDPDRYYLGTNYQPDEWDRWNSERDEHLSTLKSKSTLPYESGWSAEELDQYGSWYSVPSYGTVWRPHCDSNWVPFSMGRWAWYNPFGWTWVSFEPWGWVPYHHGRWAHVPSYGWCWVPGSYGQWCPGAVSWIVGPSWVGWVPLAPSEPWYPNGIASGSIISPRNLHQGNRVCYLPNDAFLNGASSVNFSQARDLLATGRVVSGQPLLAPTVASRIPIANGLASRKFTNDDLETRRNLRDRMIQSTIPAGSLQAGQGLSPGVANSRTQGDQGGQASSSDSRIRVINGGSRSQRESTAESNVRTYTNWNPPRESVRRTQSETANSPGGLGRSWTPSSTTTTPAPSEDPSQRQRIYRIYGIRNEGTRPARSPENPTKGPAIPRSSTSVPSAPSSASTPSAPPPRSQPGYSAPAQTPAATAAPSHSSAGSSGASSASSAQEGRSGVRGRAGR